MSGMKPMFDLSGKTALITGGSRGLGLQIAEALGDHGARIVISSRKAAELEVAHAQLNARGVDAHWIAADNAKDDDLSRLAAGAMERLGRIDILVNNAGATWGALTEDYPIEAWDKVMNVNIRSVFLLTQAIARGSMIPNRYGRVVNIASVYGLRGNRSGAQTIAYNASKGAVVNFTRALAADWGPYGITVNAIAPGFFPSKMTAGTLREVGSDALAQDLPLRRIGDSEDIKGAAVLFSSDAGKHITGQILAIDGGMSAV